MLIIVIDKCYTQFSIHASILPLAASFVFAAFRRLTGTDYQGVVSISGNIWETFRVYSAHSAPDFLKISDHFCHFDYFSIF